MKYMLLIYDNADTRATFGDDAELMREMDALMQEITASGELVGGEALAEPAATRTVRAPGGAPAVTDGPLAEAKEHFGGYLLLDVASEARAIEIAARWPNARFAAMEVRPILDGP